MLLIIVMFRVCMRSHHARTPAMWIDILLRVSGRAWARARARAWGRMRRRRGSSVDHIGAFWLATSRQTALRHVRRRYGAPRTYATPRASVCACRAYARATYLIRHGCDHVSIIYCISASFEAELRPAIKINKIIESVADDHQCSVDDIPCDEYNHAMMKVPV